MTLRDYQERAVSAVLDAIDRRPVLVAPTGAGKTRMAVEIAHRHGGRVVFVSHRHEHLDQAVRAGLIGETRTVQKRSRLEPCDLLIVDECHHAAARSYERLSAPRVVGLTATPFRLDGRPLSMFGELVVAARTPDLVDAGFLVNPRVYAFNPPAMGGVHSRGGDFITAEAYDAVKGIAGSVVKEWLRLTPGKRTLVFAVNTIHADDLTARFLAAGVRAASVNAETTNRAEIFAQLQAGDLDVVCNCMIATEGLDIPALDVVSLARPTKSLSLHLQMIGRVMRTHPGKDAAVVLDHAGNHARLGDAMQRIEYTLTGTIKPESAKHHGLWRCAKCFTLNIPSAKACVCGAERPKPKLPTEREATLTEGFARVDLSRNEGLYRMFLALARKKGHKDGWAAYQYKNRTGVWPDWSMQSRIKSSATSQAEPMSLSGTILPASTNSGASTTD